MSRPLILTFTGLFAVASSLSSPPASSPSSASSSHSYLHCLANGDLGEFSGWYETGGGRTCGDYCLWTNATAPANASAIAQYGVTYANPHTTQALASGAYWSCVLGAAQWTGAIAYNSSVIKGAQLTERGHFRSFPYQLCSEGMGQPLWSLEERFAHSVFAWVVWLLLSLLGLLLFGMCLYRQRHRSTSSAEPFLPPDGNLDALYSCSAQEISPSPYLHLSADSDQSASAAEFQGNGGGPLPELELANRVVGAARRCHRCCWGSFSAEAKRATCITSACVCACGSLMWTVVCIASLAESAGSLYVPIGGAWLTPACSANVGKLCPEGLVDITRESPHVTAGDAALSFTYVVLSDPQLEWVVEEHVHVGTGSPPRECDGRDSCAHCRAKHAFTTNHDQMLAVEAMLRGVQSGNDGEGWDWATPDTLVLNGDLTAFYHPAQRAKYESHFHNVDRLGYFYPGLGNHDYMQGGAQYGLDQWLTVPSGSVPSCNEKRAVEYLRAGVGCGTVPRFFGHTLTRYHADSMAYSWDKGQFHFVQLHLYPTFESPSLSISSSLDWLELDLADAHQKGRYSIVNVHAANLLTPAFRHAVEGKNVVAILTGHLHRCLGSKCMNFYQLTDLDIANDPAVLTRAARCTSSPCVSDVFFLDNTTDPGAVMRKMRAQKQAREQRHPSQGQDASLDSRRQFACPAQSNSRVFVNATDGSNLCLYEEFGVSNSFPFPWFFRGGVVPPEVQSIPIFWSGSSSYQTFLRIGFSQTAIKVEAFSSEDGIPARYRGTHFVPNVIYPKHTAQDLARVIRLRPPPSPAPPV